MLEQVATTVFLFVKALNTIFLADPQSLPGYEFRRTLLGRLVTFIAETLLLAVDKSQPAPAQ